MEQKPQYKRKRKESFARKARKYQKRGGHGTHVDQTLFEYFCRVLDVWNKGFDSDEDKRIFADNVLEQTVGSEMELATSMLTSRAIDTVIQAASADKVRGLENALRKDLRLAFVDKFASHLIQKLIILSAERVSAGESEGDEPFVDVCIKFAINNVEEFAWHFSACHVLRSCIDALTILGERMCETYPKLFYGVLIEAPSLPDICKMELGSGLLQVLLKCLHKVQPKMCQKAINKLIKNIFAPKEFGEDITLDEKKCDEPDDKDCEKPGDARIDSVFTTQPSIRLLECCIECSSSKRFTQIYAALFINRLTKLAKDRSANMAVQALIKSVQEVSEFESIFDELVPSFKEILMCGHSGVLFHLAATCQRLSTRQGQYFSGLLQCLNCHDSELLLVTKCLALGNHEQVTEEDSVHNDNKLYISLHGSLIIQSLLNFKKPIKVINSLLNTETSLLVKVLCDPRGSHISNAFFSAQYVGEKSKEKLFHKLKDSLVDLAITKHGSRSFDILWDALNFKQRQTAVSKLCERESEVNSSQFGRFIASKVCLSSFRHNPKGWASKFSSSNDPKKLFSDIIEKNK